MIYILEEVLVLRKAKEGFLNHTQDIYKNRKKIQGCFAFIDHIYPYALSYRNSENKYISRENQPLNIKLLNTNEIVWGRNFKIVNWKYNKKTNMLELKTRKIIKTKAIDDFVEIEVGNIKEQIDFIKSLKKTFGTRNIKFTNKLLIEYMLNEIIIENIDVEYDQIS